MATVRYIVDDVEASLAFYHDHLGFQDAGHPGGGSRPMPDGTRQEPGGWNRFALEVDDLQAAVDRLQAAGVAFRSDIITGIGGKQALVQDPSGNLIELFQPTLPEARERSAFGHHQQK